MRIALLTDFPRDLDSPYGGVEAVARSLALGLGRCRDVELHVITARPDVRRRTLVQLNRSVTIHTLPRLNRLELPTLFLHHRLVLRERLNNLQPEVVHVNSLGGYAYACGALGYRYVLTVHGFESTERQVLGVAGPRARARLALLRVVEKASLQRAAAIIANSSYVIRHVPASFRRPVSCIPNPVDPLFFEHEVHQPTEGRILWVGVIIPRKGLDLLLHALHALRFSLPEAHVRVIGPCSDPAYMHQLEQLREELALVESVEFVGPRNGSALRAEYASAQVLALPSREENVPVAIAEAMAVGRPVVATDVGGVSDLVQDGLTGRLIPAHDVQALARALLEVLTHERDRREMGAKARSAAQARFSLDAVVERHLSVYETMMGNTRADY
jgi:glycosyltransferase involved in cell wall biosynthesis